jgi:folate-binding Fe-S cluster repair protein YgfZ
MLMMLYWDLPHCNAPFFLGQFVRMFVFSKAVILDCNAVRVSLMKFGLFINAQRHAVV